LPRSAGLLRDLPSFPTRRSSDLHVVQSAADSVLCQIWHNPKPSETRGRVLLKACGDELLSHIVPLEIDWHENKPWRKCDSSFSRSEEHTSELQSRSDLVCRLLLE